jgi:hypothetical protein
MFRKTLSTVRNLFLSLILLTTTAFFPAVSFAATASDAATCTPPSSSEPGVRVPTGAEAGMFTYDCDLGVWQSDHYTYNPATDSTSPRDSRVYTYNDGTGLWDVDMWVYVSSQGAYFLRTYSVSTPPAGAATVGGPKPVEAPVATSNSVPNSAPSDVSGTPSNNNSANAGLTNNTSATVNNTIGSAATSGNALIVGNTTGGSALSGNALALATVVNMLQSSGNTFGASGNAVTFVSNINGDVNGDLLLDPALIGAIQPASGDITLNNANNTDQSINNNIRLAAESGAAAVDSNTNAGNATTGTATAVANVLNFLNSAVTSGQSFLGVVNINGNLNGDILMPPGFIDQLLASNVPTVSINTGVDLTNNTNQSINNAVTASANSGNATVDKNTSAGNATTGTAGTHITAFNLTGSTIVGSNDLLVFVNVLGTWYGMIFNAPGATSAQLGSGITSNTTGNNTATNNTNQSITNNIDVSARSGDASVIKNTSAGNATTGDARAAVNLLNIANSNLSLANWFGILFINVFGTWNGSFGFNTAAGDPVVSPSQGVDGGRGGESTPANTPGGGAQMFTFVARTVGSAGITGTSSTPTSTRHSSTSSAEVNSNQQQGVVLASHSVQHTPRVSATLPTTEGTHVNYWLPAVGVTLGIGMLLFERVRNFRQTH